MKVRVYADEFKNAVAKIAPVIPKRTAMSSLQSVRIKADDNNITLYATDLENAVSISIPGVVIEYGCAHVMYDDLKKITNIKDDVVITTDIMSGTIEFRTPKKTYTVRALDFYEDTLYTIKADELFTSKTEIPEEIMANLKPLALMASTNDFNGIMTGLFFDLAKSRIATLDGHRIGILGIDTRTAESFIAPCKIVPIMKNLIGKRTGGKIKVEISKKLVRYTGEDFVCYQKPIEGEYYNIDVILKGARENYDTVFTVDNKEISEIAKEYKKVIPADDRRPMIIAESKGIVCTGVQLQSYKTSDVLETAKLKSYEDGFYVGVNPVYIMDAASYIKTDLEIRLKSPKNPIYIRSEDGQKECVVLPVNCMGTPSIDYVRKQAG